MHRDQAISSDKLYHSTVRSGLCWCENIQRVTPYESLTSRPVWTNVVRLYSPTLSTTPRGHGGPLERVEKPYKTLNPRTWKPCALGRPANTPSTAMYFAGFTLLALALGLGGLTTAEPVPASNAERLAKGLGPLHPRKLYTPSPVEMAKRARGSGTALCFSPYYISTQCCPVVGTRSNNTEIEQALEAYSGGASVGPNTLVGKDCFQFGRWYQWYVNVGG